MEWAALFVEFFRECSLISEFKLLKSYSVEMVSPNTFIIRL